MTWSGAGVLLLIAAVGFVAGGCSSTNITKVAQAVAGDPAVLVVKVSSIYGTASFTRIGTPTNSMSIAPDGTVTINRSGTHE